MKGYKCLVCGGSGKVTAGIQTCPSCKGLKEIRKAGRYAPCRDCNSLGIVYIYKKCDACGGSGRQNG